MDEIIKKIEQMSTPSLVHDEDEECCNCGECLSLESYEWYSEGYQDALEDVVKFLKRQ